MTMAFLIQMPVTMFWISLVSRRRNNPRRMTEEKKNTVSFL